MRSCAELYYEGFARHDRESWRRAYHYTVILLSFFFGAVIRGALSLWQGEKAIWMCCVLLLIAWNVVSVERKGKA